MKRDRRLVRLSREHTQALMLAQRIERAIPAASDGEVGELYSTVIAFWSASLLIHFTAESECLLARLVRPVRVPRWCSLKESVSFILAETEPNGAVEAHLSFRGEPFMARMPGKDIPRYIFHVQAHSELIGRLLDLERSYRLGR